MTEPFPVSSMLYPDLYRYKYADSFVVALQRNDVEPRELIAAFFESTPRWFSLLFQLRNRIVAVFGLKTAASGRSESAPACQVGQTIGLFRIFAMTDTEVVLGQDDSHLDFRTSLLLHRHEAGADLFVSTLVHTRNRLGVLYFTVVKPFHCFAVPILARAMAKRLDARRVTMPRP